MKKLTNILAFPPPPQICMKTCVSMHICTHTYTYKTKKCNLALEIFLYNTFVPKRKFSQNYTTEIDRQKPPQPSANIFCRTNAATRIRHLVESNLLLCLFLFFCGCFLCNILIIHALPKKTKQNYVHLKFHIPALFTSLFIWFCKVKLQMTTCVNCWFNNLLIHVTESPLFRSC